MECIAYPVRRWDEKSKKWLRSSKSSHQKYVGYSKGPYEGNQSEKHSIRGVATKKAMVWLMVVTLAFVEKQKC